MSIRKIPVTFGRLGILAVTGCFFLSRASVSVAAGDVGVFVANPVTPKYIAAAQLLRRQLPGARARWNEVDATGGTFTLTFYSDSPRSQSAQPCRGLPVSVQVKQGQLTSAVYAASSATCKAGTAVRAADDPRLYALLLPSALFQELSSQVDRGVLGQGCIEASFDDDFGLPTAIHEGCPGVKGSDVRIQVSDIVSVQQALWNRWITWTGVVLCLLALAIYQYQKARRRQEAMPELLLR